LILVDTSIWIDFIRAGPRDLTGRVLKAARDQPIVVGDVVLMEVLMGVRDERAFVNTERLLRAFPIVEIVSEEVALRAARAYRDLRGRGVTIRSTIDVLIGSWCLLHGAFLMHRDRDFDAMEKHLGLDVLHA
jgi:hypothetical protein